MFDLFQNLCQKYKVHYADLRSITVNSEKIFSDDHDVSISSNSSDGVGIRILKDGKWSIASSSTGSTLNDLFENANKLLIEAKTKFSQIKPIQAEYSTKFKKDPFSIPFKDKVEFLLDIKKRMDSPEIQNTKSVVAFLKSSERFISSEGSDIKTSYCKSIFISTSVARVGDNIQPVSYRNTFISGYEGINSVDIDKITSDMKKKMKRLLNAIPAPPGRFKIVCDPELTGLFFHEAVGHASEADSILNKSSVFKNMLGKKIASSQVSLTDDPTKKSWGHYKFDDEGIRASPTKIIDSGILSGFLHSRETASQMRVESTGNGRVDSIASFPIPRMSNLIIGNGNYSFDDLIDFKQGIYAKGFRGGQVDTITGNFVFGCEEAFLIKNGEISTPLRDVSLSGNVIDSLKGIDAVGKKSVSTSAGGSCGKRGQFVPVGEISPHMRIKNIIVGGRV